MSKKLENKFEIPLFTDEATGIWKDMPNIVQGIVARKQEAIDRFNRLDTIVNGGELREIGQAFGEKIYARVDNRDPYMADYLIKRLSSMMGAFMSNSPEEIVLDGKKYTVVLKEDL